MAKLNEKGNILANCVYCDGALTTFIVDKTGVSITKGRRPNSRMIESDVDIQHRFFTCSSCGSGAVGSIRMKFERAQYPDGIESLIYFSPETIELYPIPRTVPDELAREFREAERCLGNETYRAAAALFRSVLEKTLKANGYNEGVGLGKKIDLAANDGLITESRKKLAQENIHVLGNDVLHDEWREISESEVQESRKYCQRILEDFYSDRATVERILKSKDRSPGENVKK